MLCPQALIAAAARALSVPSGTAHELLFGNGDLVREFAEAARAVFSLHAAAFALRTPATMRVAAPGEALDGRLFRSSTPDNGSVGFMVFPAFELDQYTVFKGTVFGV